MFWEVKKSHVWEQEKVQKDTFFLSNSFHSLKHKGLKISD